VGGERKTLAVASFGRSGERKSGTHTHGDGGKAAGGVLRDRLTAQAVNTLLREVAEQNTDTLSMCVRLALSSVIFTHSTYLAEQIPFFTSTRTDQNRQRTLPPPRHSIYVHIDEPGGNLSASGSSTMWTVKSRNKRIRA